MSLKDWGPNLLNSSPLYMYLKPRKKKLVNPIKKAILWGKDYCPPPQCSIVMKM